MNNTEAIEIIKTAIAKVEWDYPMEYAAALDKAVEALKEQEAVEPKLVGVNTWTCGECGALFGWEEFTRSGLELIKYKFCPECGRKVKWDG